MDYQKLIQQLARDPREKLWELIIQVVKMVIEKNIGNLFSKNITDGIKKSLNDIRAIMREHDIPVPQSDKDLYKEIIQPAYLKMTQVGR